ncbi:MAG: cytochrome c oxidase subunit 3 [Planctomycetota bacterium]
MSTIEAGAESASDAHGHDHDHDHPPFLAHHFDTPEQQFDSGKLGIWLFLVTEILFFSGMFCAYAIFRMLRPDVFEGCSQFLNTKLGAINTGVLLFSSLTMAWAVRCSQIEQHKGLVAMLATTLSCAMMFLGVKAIEYSHKFGMGLLPAGLYFYNPDNPHPEGQPNYLLYICAPFALIAIGVIIWLVMSIINGNKFHTAIAKPLTVVCLSFFIGIGLGMLLESEGAESHAEHHGAVGHHDEDHAADGDHAHGDEHAAAEGDHDAEHGDEHEGENPSEADSPEASAVPAEIAATEPEGTVEAGTTESETGLLERLATDETNSGVRSELEARQRQAEVAGSAVVTDADQVSGAIASVEGEVLTQRQAGVFFSIYYCMTGIHAIHILAGIGVLVWLLVRAVRQDFNPQYFGPVDYVGLYWHLVDLIWIYLFPLLYLIR